MNPNPHSTNEATFASVVQEMLALMLQKDSDHSSRPVTAKQVCFSAKSDRSGDQMGVTIHNGFLSRFWIKYPKCETRSE